MHTNPFNISDDPSLIMSHQLPNYSSVFKQEIISIYVQEGGGISLLEVAQLYTCSLLISYYDNAGIVPTHILELLSKQPEFCLRKAFKKFGRMLCFDYLYG